MNITTLDPIALSISSPITMVIGNINFYVGVPLNIYVVVLLTRDGGLDRSLIFTLSQIAVEILFAMQAPLYILCNVNVEHLCFYYPVKFITGSCMPSRFLFQCCVCFERYMAVVHPVTFLKYKTTNNRLIVSGFIWMYALIAGIVVMLMISTIAYSIIVTLYTIIVCVMLFCSVSLLRDLRRPGPGARDDGGMSIAKRKAFKVVFVNFLMFLIQAIPLSVSFGIYFTRPYYDFVLALMVSVNIFVAVGLMQPVLFLYQNGKLTCVRRG